MKHKHYDCIVAWADGAEIQWLSILTGHWEDVDMNGKNWHEHYKYRIKPEPTPDVVKIFYLESHPFLGLRFSEEINPIKDKTKRISCTFDSTTGKLKAVEMV
jgi:hypothetical protein